MPSTRTCWNQYSIVLNRVYSSSDKQTHTEPDVLTACRVSIFNLAYRKIDGKIYNK